MGKIKRQIAQIVASVHKPSRPETYYYELDQTYYSATSSTFIGQVLGLLGLRSIADAAKGTAANGGYPQLSGEFILKANPDYILLADTICCGQSVATVAGRPGWSGLAAVKGGRVLGLNDDIASRWGPRVVDLLSEVAAELRVASGGWLVVTATAPARPIGTPLVPDVRGPGVRHTWVPMAVAAVLMVVLSLVALCTGPVAVSPSQVLGTLLAHVPLLHFHTSTPAIDQAIVWQLRAPRVVLAGIVGAMLAAGGAAYQGLFRNPLADPYLLGVAAGAGLGATVEIVYGGDSSAFLPIFAFVGGSLAVAATYLIGVAGGRRAWGRSIVLAGVAVAALLTAIQTYLQQRDQEQIRQIYNWILGSFSVASWSDVTLILPYVVVSAAVLLAHRRMLDVLRVGEDEAGTLGIHPARTRVIVVAAATLGTAAAVSVSGLIGFVGIIVPHTVRLTAGASYRIILPVAMVGGAAFLIGADLIARTAQAPAEVPIGVVTACIGAPFFLVVLVSRRAGRGMES